MPKVELELEVHPAADPDDVRERRELAANLATDNWRDLLTGLLRAEDTSHKVQLTDTNGSTNDYTTYDSNDLFNDEAGVVGYLGSRIAVGDGGGSAVTPGRGDTSLDNRLGKDKVGEPSKTSDGTVVSTTLTNTSGGTWTIRETGILMRLQAQDGNGHSVLMFHDSVAALDVSDDEAVTVTYTLTWP